MYTEENNIDKFYEQKITSFDIGELEIYKGRVLIIRSSHNILFFMLEHDEDLDRDEWRKYHSFES